MQLVRNELPMTVLMHSQINFWFTARSAILRALHMFWQQMPLVDTDNLCLLIFNPLKRRFSTGEVLTSPETDGIYTFNRLYLDHAITSGCTETFPLLPEELASAMVYELRGLTLRALAPMQQELNCRTLFGYHCRGLVGHCILTLSQGRMIGITADDMTFHSQFGTLATGPEAPVTDEDQMITDDNEASSSTATVTLGKLPLGHTVTVNVQLNN
eukprot:Skav234515  [mRNA]  locus=scaffold2162:187303:187944:+ [translate_table: standard]